MSLKMRQLWIGGLAALIMTTSACGGRNNDSAPGPITRQQKPNISPLNQSDGQQMKLLSQDAIIPTVSNNGVSYISLNDLVKLLQFQSQWDEQSLTYRIGDNDVAYELKMNSMQAVKEEEPVTLKASPILLNGSPHVPVLVLQDLFQEEMDYELQDHSLLVHPSNSQVDISERDDENAPITNDELDFTDDPEDPFKGTDESANEGKEEFVDETVWSEILPIDSIPAATLKNINMNKLIQTAQRYRGVDYQFGTSPYPSSGRFDCSSYTRYLYEKYGINLPRTARAQAKRGEGISRKSLRKGDLLFFYVPGRFKSNRKVGHVGIYMGNGNMIHSSPAPKDGVQISRINKAYWKKTFLKARRIAY